MRVGRVFVLAWLVGCAGFGTAAGARPQPTSKPAVPQPLTIASLTGQDTFEAYCAPCHGTYGAGDGPVALSLKASMPDLRRLALRRSGVFPRDEVVAYVTGKGRPVQAHGSAEMPIWGPTFRSLDPNDVRVNVRIQNVVDYVQSMQLK